MKIKGIVCPYCGTKQGEMCTLHTDVVPNIECNECGGFFDVKIRHTFEACESDNTTCDICGMSIRRVYTERVNGVTYCPSCFDKKENTNG